MSLIRGRLLPVVLLVLALASCQTEDGKPEPPYVSTYQGKGANKGSTASVPTQAKESQYAVEFRSRYALTYGHTYVVFGRVDKGGNIINPEVAGLAPASPDAAPYVLGHFVPVPATTGWSDGDLEEEYRSASWKVLMNQAQYDKTVAYIRGLQSRSKLWSATVYNCNAFVADIARSMGYQTPGIWLRPQQFVTKLREMNGGSNASVARTG
ncbi:MULTISPECIES: hypothetical protein [unclassified Sinorhizobium]|uniref:hypothetical protein n=1 Tax=unclassified Sinorhizobium TaxID=2613772 RepID=UPI003524C0F4